MNEGAASHANWVYDSPVHSDVEAKLRSFLVELRKEDKILGIQVRKFLKVKRLSVVCFYRTNDELFYMFIYW